VQCITLHLHSDFKGAHDTIRRNKLYLATNPGKTQGQIGINGGA